MSAAPGPLATWGGPRVGLDNQQLLCQPVSRAKPRCQLPHTFSGQQRLLPFCKTREPSSQRAQLPRLPPGLPAGELGSRPSRGGQQGGQMSWGGR